ncbi:hypothetical protein MMIC_P1223 [Mariprofundus micogutta]|uniref:Uncharacterized protein n=2 Tax=Mariprofundus micogutta TaxID=1921010 RepID=A0A1L8CN56_9PROT|nr:hypothetical protein MMIC_P1223 [Mariprofundus micogutta]
MGNMPNQDHMQGDMDKMKGTTSAFLVTKEIDGYTVSFHVMKAKEGMQHGGSHHSAGVPNGTAVSRPQGEGQDAPSHHSARQLNGMASSHPQGKGQDAPSHNLMAKVEKDGKALTDLVVNSKVTHPNNKSESKMLMKMGDWYMAGYDLGHEGQHQLMILFKTADGTKHFGGVYFPENAPEQKEFHKEQAADHEQHH